MNQELRVQLGLTYGAGARYEATPEWGAVSARADTGVATANDVARRLARILAETATRPFKPAELSTAQAVLTGNRALLLTSTRATARTISETLAKGWPATELDNYGSRISAVTEAQVEDFAKLYWSIDALQTVLVGPFTGHEASPIAGHDCGAGESP